MPGGSAVYRLQRSVFRSGELKTEHQAEILRTHQDAVILNSYGAETSPTTMKAYLPGFRLFHCYAIRRPVFRFRASCGCPLWMVDTRPKLERMRIHNDCCAHLSRQGTNRVGLTVF
jgi:hypothetical protein